MPISAEEGSGNLLKVEHIDTFYGHHQALWDVSAEVHQGEIVAIIGSNGAGKSTFLKTVAGLIRPKNGRILYEGTDITVWPANRSVRNGITLCPEGRKVFPALSVWEIFAWVPTPGPAVKSLPIRSACTACSHFERAPQAGCRNALGRRTANAGHWACHDEQSKASYARRAVSRSFSRADRKDF